MKRILIVLCTVLATAASADASFAAQKPEAQVSPQDGTFVRDTALDNEMQIKMGQMAARKGAGKEVKSFGQKLAKETASHHRELKGIARRKGIPVPADVDRERQMKLDELAKKSGPGFDRAFIGMMAPDHRNHIDRFQQEAVDGKDPDLKEFASRQLPRLKEHQNELDRIQTRMARK